MLIDSRDELLIQRCVDGELSPVETRSLLQRLDGLDGGWKKLACELLEDRGLRGSLASDIVVDERPRWIDSSRTVRGSEPVRRLVARDVATVAGPTSTSRLRTWWSHPITSLSLCAAIAFVGGMLIPDGGADREIADSRAVPGLGSGAALSNSSPRAMNAENAPAGSYSIQLDPDGPSVDVPVYGRLEDLVRSDRNNPLVSGAYRPGGSGSGQIQWIFVPVDDGRSMLIPVSENTVGGMQ